MNDEAKRKYIEGRMHRLVGMSPDKLEEMHKASGSTEWWARCWNCKKTTKRTRDELMHSNCDHCGVNLWKRQ